MGERLLCPECGEPLSARLLLDDKTGELIVDIGCEGARASHCVLAKAMH
jgi:hypothetical protein